MDAYQIGPKLILRGFLLGSFFVCLVGLHLSNQIILSTRAEESPHTTNEIVLSPESGLDERSVPSNQNEENISTNLQCEVSKKFPDKVRQWCDLIMEASEKHNIHPNLIASVILIESGGDPLAYSRSGAVGLMQVMPRDGLASQFHCVNGPCFANRPTIKQLQDPRFNLNYGTKYLAGLIKRYGNYRDALKAYGPIQVGYSYADKVLSIYKKFGK